MSYARESSSRNMFTDSVCSSAQVMAAWKTHLGKLSEAEREMFLKYRKSDLAQYVSGIEDICRKQGDQSKGLGVARLFKPLFGTMNLYAPVARIMIQADPTSSALVLGGITCVMAINDRVLTYHDKIVEMLADMGEKIPILIEYGSEIHQNNDSVQEALVEVFGDILQFCSKAYHMYWDKDGKPRTSAYTFIKALGKSFEMHFGETVQKFEKDLQHFEDRAQLCDRRETKDFRSLQVQYMRHHTKQVMHMHQAMLSMSQQQMPISMNERPMEMLEGWGTMMIEAMHHEQEQEKANGIVSIPSSMCRITDLLKN